jgi:hypothetical protein
MIQFISDSHKLRSTHCCLYACLSPTRILRQKCRLLNTEWPINMSWYGMTSTYNTNTTGFPKGSGVSFAISSCTFPYNISKLSYSCSGKEEQSDYLVLTLMAAVLNHHKNPYILFKDCKRLFLGAVQKRATFIVVDVKASK